MYFMFKTCNANLMLLLDFIYSANEPRLVEEIYHTDGLFFKVKMLKSTPYELLFIESQTEICMKYLFKMLSGRGTNVE